MYALSGNNQYHCTLHATNGNEASNLELILHVDAEVRDSSKTTNGMRVLYTIERPMGMRHLTMSSSLMLQMFSTAQKQPMAWEYCTVYTLHATNGNEAPQLEVILDAANGRHSPKTTNSMTVYYSSDQWERGI
jgi:hypothetical protein